MCVRSINPLFVWHEYILERGMIWKKATLLYPASADVLPKFACLFSYEEQGWSPNLYTLPTLQPQYRLKPLPVRSQGFITLHPQLKCLCRPGWVGYVFSMFLRNKVKKKKVTVLRKYKDVIRVDRPGSLSMVELANKLASWLACSKGRQNKSKVRVGEGAKMNILKHSKSCFTPRLLHKWSL